MRDFLRASATLLFLPCATEVYAQQSQPTAAPAVPEAAAVRNTGAIPNVIRFSGSFRPANGQPAQPVESVTLSVYHDQTGGTPLWQETQNVDVDAEGKYSVLMGSTQNDGVPLDLLSAGEPRWLGVQVNRPGEAEQPRVLMASVPYALKASDAETLGGRPASAYLLAGGTSSGVTASGIAAGGIAATTGVTTPTTVLTNATTGVKPRATTGTAGFIGVFTDANDMGNSVIQQANGNVGIGTVPGANAGTAPSLDLRTSPFSQIGMGQTVDYLTFFASDLYGPAIYWDPTKDLRLGKGGSGLYNAFGFVEQMRIQSSTGNVGIGTMSPGSKLDVAGDVSVRGALSVGNGIIGSVNYGGVPILAGRGDPTNIGLGIGALLALELNSSATFNSAVGFQALSENDAGSGNTAVGARALTANTTGEGNAGLGSGALGANTGGAENTALGGGAMLLNTTGNDNTAVGTGALNHNVAGNNNIAIGSGAAYTVSAGSGNIHIGSIGVATDSEVIRIGNNLDATRDEQTQFFVAGVASVNLGGDSNAVGVLIDTVTGQLGVASSSRRCKEEIQDMGEASRDLMRLRPVTFRYKQPFDDGTKPTQYGLIAEEVDEVYPDLVAHSADGQIETVKYQALDSMLLNEVQKQNQHARQQDETIRRQQEQVAQQQEVVFKQQEQIKSLEARLAALEGLLTGKVSAAATAGR